MFYKLFMNMCCVFMPCKSMIVACVDFEGGGHRTSQEVQDSLHLSLYVSCFIHKACKVVEKSQVT
jgi:hypothetical protein